MWRVAWSEKDSGRAHPDSLGHSGLSVDIEPVAGKRMPVLPVLLVLHVFGGRSVWCFAGQLDGTQEGPEVQSLV
jgi:hypothetical protein